MHSEPFVVVAVFRARPGDERSLRAALVTMLAPTREEPGCINYDLHGSSVDEAVFFFHETWRSEDDHAAHLDTPHVQHLLAVTRDLLREPIVEFKGRRLER